MFEAETKDAGAPAEGAKRRRLLWRTDRDGRFEFVSPEAADVAEAPRAGETLVDYALRVGTAAALIAAVESRASFMDVPVGLVGGRHLSFAGAPRRTATLGFTGFTGFALAPAAVPPTASDGREVVQAARVEHDRAPAAIPQAPRAAATNVVPLRPGFVNSPAAANANGFVDLDPHERNAFREIARALGARPADEGARAPFDLRDGPPDPPDDGPHPDAPAADVVGDGPEPAHLVAALDRLPVGVVVHRDGAPLYANRTALELLGFADLAGFAGSGGLRPVLSVADEGLADRDCGHPVTLRAADGEVIAAQARSQTLDWPGGAATLLSLHRPSAALAGRGAEAAAFDLVAEGLALLDVEGRVLSLNAAAEATLGYGQNEIAGEPFHALLRGDAHAPFRARLEAARAGGKSAEPFEASLRAAGGRVATARLRVGSLPAGGEARFAVAIRDETEALRVERGREAAVARAEAASAEKSRFLARMSHEIRTPLNAVVGFAELMIEGRFGEIGNERYREYLKDIHASASHVTSLVNDLLDLAKIEAGRSEMNFAAVDLVAVAREAASLMQGEAARARVVLRLSCPSRPLRVVADARSLRQILLNLLSNALKFTAPGGQAILSVARGEAGEATLRVRDTGEGMDEAGLVAALEPFGQAHPGRAGGTGLGLPLTKAMAEANRARFSLSSAKGEGTLAEVLFPARSTLVD
ncbi:MAG: PAS domain-containing sensor histidine kinase [Hyphomicrobiales bacterium]|nr:PAS domain-containing sensor histidine kinase [Hyphomicrobiales bacterium]